MRKNLFIICLITLISIPLSTLSHPGRTDKYGGHTEKATGQYHIHNEDGTLTYTTKPTESNQSQQKQSTAPAEQSTPNNVSQSNTTTSTSTPSSVEPIPANVAQTTPEQSPSGQNVQPQHPDQDISVSQPESLPPVSVNETTATVGTTTKPLQQDVTDNITSQENNVSTTTVYTYTTESTNGISLNLFLIIVLGFFALIGICMVSAVVHLSLKKLEGKSQNVDFFLYIPFVVVIIPAYIGELLFKAYIKLSEKSPPNPKQQSKKKDNFI